MVKQALAQIRSKAEWFCDPARNEHEAMGLLTIDDSGIQVTASGWYVVRAIAMVFDRYLQADRNRAKFSRVI